MSQRTARALADETATPGAPRAIDADPFDGMLDELAALEAEGPYGPREAGRPSSPYDQRGVPGAFSPARGTPRRPDALDRMIELAGMLDPEDWLGSLTAHARG
jgi:hypothetical protein